MNELQPQQPNNDCLDRGLLVSLRDDELTAEETSQAMAHLAACADCAANERDINKSSREVYDLLSALGPTSNAIPEPAPAFAAIQTRLQAEGQQEESSEALPTLTQSNIRLFPTNKPQRRLGWLMTAAAAALIALLVLPNAGALANQFLALFRVQQFQPVTVNPQNFRFDFLSNLQDLGNLQTQYDDLTYLKNPTQAQVEHYIHFPLSLPSQLPAGVGHVLQFTIIPSGHATFTFSAAKARAYLAQNGESSVPIPAQLDGARFNITIAPGFIVNYANTCQQQGQTPSIDSSSSPVLPDKAAVQCSGGKPFYLGEIPSPVVQASGKASLKDLRDFVLSLPNLPSQLRVLLQHIDLDSGIVPLPIPPEIHAQPVTTHGTSGVLLYDASMKLGAVLWQTHGIIYMIASATTSSTELLGTANSLR